MLLVSVLVGLATVGGLILLVIPGIYIGVRLAVSIEALVVEGRRGTQAMGRSWELVGGLVACLRDPAGGLVLIGSSTR